VAGIFFFMQKDTLECTLAFTFDTLVLLLQGLYHYQVIQESERDDEPKFKFLAALTGKV